MRIKGGEKNGKENERYHYQNRSIAAMIIAAVISTAFVVIGIGAIGLLLIGFNSICAFVGISSWAIVKIVFIAFLLLFIWCV